MEESKKLYSQKAIAIATYLGGPMAAAYLVKKNYKADNQEEKGKKVYIIGIISTILLFAGIFAIPEYIIEKIPNAIIPAIYTGIIYLLIEKLQGVWLKEHKESGGEFYSGWKGAGIGAIFMLIIAAFIFGIAFIAGDLSTPDFDATTYDKKIEQFSANENKSLEVYQLIDTAESEYLVQEFNSGIDLWKANKRIVKQLNAIQNLPESLLEQNKKLMEYCDLRIKHNAIIVKAVLEDTDIYVSEIESIGLEINKIVAQM
jgi:hypothetical protein